MAVALRPVPLWRGDAQPPAPPDTVARWDAELERICPRQPHASWLRMVWEPGDPWAPVQRWMVYEMEPRSVNPTGVYWSLADGHDPRQENRFDRVLGRMQRKTGMRGSWLARLGYKLYRETGCFPRPFWVVQGDWGGHLRYYGQLHQRAAVQAGLEADPPAPGSLPYAEPDQRTWAAIARQDRLRQAAAGLNSLDPAARRDALERLNAELLRDLANGLEDIVKDVNPTLDTVPTGQWESAAVDEWQDRFLDGSDGL